MRNIPISRGSGVNRRGSATSGTRPSRWVMRRTRRSRLNIRKSSTRASPTKPWTITKTFRREREKILWYEDICNENNNHVAIGKDYYFLSADGYLMPTRKGQEPPDLRYFQQTKK